MKVNLFVLLVCLFVACKKAPQKIEKENNQEISLVQKIEKAHHRKEFLSHHAIQFSAIIQFSGNEIFNGVMTLATDSSKALLEYADGSKVYVVKDKVYHSPNMVSNRPIRFDAYTWQYFFLFPYKLSDEGTFWSKESKQNLNGDMCNVQTLSFKKGIGDSSDDWYIVYSDMQTNRLKALAYIVTFGKTKEKAEKNPHAIRYSDYKMLEGIPVASTWSFSGWDTREGLTKVMGNASLSNFKFVSVEDTYFKAPENFLLK